MFGHAEVGCLCDVDICAVCCSAVGRGKHGGGRQRLTEDRGRRMVSNKKLMGQQ